MKHALRQTLVISALSMTLIVNALANILPINGITTGERSDAYPTLFTPAGYVFSIWGLIYLGLIAYAIFQALPAQKENGRLQALAPWFILNATANTVWVFTWHYDLIGLSMLLISIVLVSLIFAYRALRTAEAGVTRAEIWTTRLPFSIYLGWLTVATVANASVWLYQLGWAGFGISSGIWTVLMIVVASLLGLAFLFFVKDFAYTFVLIWAFVGIAVKHWDVQLVAISAVVAAALLVVACLLRGMAPGTPVKQMSWQA